MTDQLSNLDSEFLQPEPKDDAYERYVNVLHRNGTYMLNLKALPAMHIASAFVHTGASFARNGMPTERACQWLDVMVATIKEDWRRQEEQAAQERSQ
jgi:hypothetical protein